MTSWDAHARRLTGESDVVRDNSLKKMRAIKTLDDLLKAELKRQIVQNGFLETKHFLAFDVITSLERQSLFNDLLAQAAYDQTGYSYHTLNTLMNEKNGARVVEIYRQRLMSLLAPVPSKLTLLDTLGRLGFELSLSDLKILKNAAHISEISSILSYIRTAILEKSRLQYNQLLPDFLNEKSVEIKMQTLFLIEEVLQKKNLSFAATWPRCELEPDSEVKKFCQKLSGQN